MRQPLRTRTPCAPAAICLRAMNHPGARYFPRIIFLASRRRVATNFSSVSS